MAVPVPNSSTGGFMLPVAPAPIYADALEDVFHDSIQGILGWPTGELVRPRWQPEPPDSPQAATDWVAFGITVTSKDFDSARRFDPTYNWGDPTVAGADLSFQDEQLELFLSYYGPNSMALQSQFEDGVKWAQNRALFEAVGIKFMGAHDAHQVPVLLMNRWVRRVDQRMAFRRRVRRVYPVLAIVSAEVGLDNEHYVTDISVNPPPP